MSESLPWLTPVIQWGLWFVLMSLIMGWLARSRLRSPARTTGGLVLELPKSLLIIGLVATVMFGAFAILAYPSPTGGAAISAFFLLFVALGSYMIFAYFNDRYELRPDGLAHRKLFGGERVVRWADIRAISYSSTWSWFVLKLSDGTTLRLSVMLIGLPALAQALLAHLDPTTIADDAVAIIQKTAQGEPPSAWM